MVFNSLFILLDMCPVLRKFAWNTKVKFGSLLGDYKTQIDGISTPFEPVKCNTFITECTFGLPVFQWEDPIKVHDSINQWWAQNQAEKTSSLLMGYSLGKIQRLLKHLDPTIGKIYTHGATEQMTQVLRQFIDFPETELITRETTKKEVEGNLVLSASCGFRQ